MPAVRGSTKRRNTLRYSVLRADQSVSSLRGRPAPSVTTLPALIEHAFHNAPRVIERHVRQFSQELLVRLHHFGGPQKRDQHQCRIVVVSVIHGWFLNMLSTPRA